LVLTLLARLLDEQGPISGASYPTEDVRLSAGVVGDLRDSLRALPPWPAGRLRLAAVSGPVSGRTPSAPGAADAPPLRERAAPTPASETGALLEALRPDEAPPVAAAVAPEEGAPPAAGSPAPEDGGRGETGTPPRRHGRRGGPATPPRLGEAGNAAALADAASVSVEEVEALRESGLGWGEVAHELELSLGEARRELPNPGVGAPRGDPGRHAPPGLLPGRSGGPPTPGERPGAPRPKDPVGGGRRDD
jgi:hypothetical protein